MPAAPWSGTRGALAFGPSAPQPVGGPFAGLVPGMAVAEQSEDCLTLNVWTPGTEGALRPALVWLPGGAFVLGGTSLATYDAGLLAAEQDVVVVSVNYRLGALGFLALDDPAVDTNCGLRDQLLALRWVRENAASFGGDPEAVTVFGESAGAGSVLHLLASPAARGLFARAIAQSPAAGQKLQPQQAALVADTLLGQLGLDRAGVATLGDVDVDRLLAAQTATADALLMAVGAMPFHPVVDGDVLLATPTSLARDGGLAPVPLLAGCTAEEMPLFADPVFSSFDHSTLVAILEPMMSAEAGVALGTEAVDAVVTAYEQGLGGDSVDMVDVFAGLTTDAVMRLPLADLLDDHATTAPVFAYSFTWRATGAPRDVGACHGADLPFTFGTLDREGWAAWTGADVEVEAAERLSATVRQAWASFARTGVPSAEALPEWPRYESVARRTAMLGREILVAEDPLAEARLRCAALRVPSGVAGVG